MPPLFTPDGRYLIVRHRLWRAANPGLDAEARSNLVNALMAARREVGIALRNQDDTRLKQARAAVHAAKVALGERGPVWWTDGSPDLSRRLVKNTPYAEWYRSTHGMAWARRQSTPVDTGHAQLAHSGNCKYRPVASPKR